MGTELDFNFNYDKAKQRRISTKRNQTGSTGSTGSDITTAQVNSLISSALQDYGESHPIPGPVTPNTTLLGTIEGNSLTDSELRSLVWHDEFNNGQFDPEKWHKVTYGAPHLYTEGYTTEDGIYLKGKSVNTVGRLVSRQAFRNCTIKVRAKRLSLWFGTMLFDADDIPSDNEIFYQEIDYCEKYNQNNNNVYCNVHNSKLDTKNNTIKVISSYGTITGHNFYADDNWHDMELVISAPDATTGAINLIWKLDGTAIRTDTISRQNLASNAAIDHTIARQGIKIVLDRAMGKLNESYDMPVIDYVRVFANEPTAYIEAAELGALSPQGTLQGLVKGTGLIEYANTDTIQKVPNEMFTAGIASLNLDAAHTALVTAIHSGEVYGINNSKKELSSTYCPARLIALPLEAPVVPEFKYVDTDVIYEKNKKEAIVNYRFRSGDTKIVNVSWNIDSYDIKKTIFSWGGDFYSILAVRSLISKLSRQADWTETDTNADSYIQHKPS